MYFGRGQGVGHRFLKNSHPRCRAATAHAADRLSGNPLVEVSHLTWSLGPDILVRGRTSSACVAAAPFGLGTLPLWAKTLLANSQSRSQPTACPTHGPRSDLLPAPLPRSHCVAICEYIFCIAVAQAGGLCSCPGQLAVAGSCVFQHTSDIQVSPWAQVWAGPSQPSHASYPTQCMIMA